jgi:hypothetical protein
MYVGTYLSPQPVPGVPIKPPRRPPVSGETLLGYEVYRPQPGCCKIDGLKTEGWISIILIAIIFWPLFWVPFLMDSCYEESLQRPVYGTPGGGGIPVAVAANV